ncbi:MAG TPA: xanthine dehydrogenase family protein molybdopterin-binding subunit [Actinomycetes bacterium]|jgi:carbon-monoxide dehydrogenase large subunit|nr:xanthine dehydrogenase family protein molybdopterin-binding subunit [Actinomycetes bacterium]
MTDMGAAVRRVEDPPLLTGSARYTEDLAPPGAAHAVFVRSVLAHARVNRIDTAEAAATPGVIAVLTAADLDLEPMRPGSGPPALARPLLARDVVRFMGEAVAVVVASSREQALDAAELVAVDYEPLEVVTDPLAAVEPGAPVLFEEHGSNVVVERSWKGEPARVEACEVVVRAHLVNQRVAPAPMEPGAAVAAPDPKTGGVILWAPVQAPFWTRAAVAASLKLGAERVRVTVPAVGGAFGARIFTYPEQVVVAALALRLERPVRYVESRSESMLAMTHGRAQVQEVELGATGDGVVTDLRARIVADGGAYPGDNGLMPVSTVQMLAGPYRIPRVEGHSRLVATNTTPVTAYRGAGRPEATWLLERMLDLLAARLGLDPAEVRRRNLIQPGAFPHETATGASYDSGDYPAALERALEIAGYEKLRAEQAERRRNGDRLQIGVGLATYVEVTGFGSEMGAVTVEPDGRVTVLTGTSPHGQGHETAFAQLVAATLGVQLGQVRVVHSDTELVPSGGGTMGSRSLQVGGSAVLQASEQVLEQGRKLAAHLLEARVEDVVVHPGHGLGVAGAPATALSWGELAQAVTDPERQPPGVGSALAAEVSFKLDGSTYPFGAHVAVVEVDVETGLVRLFRHVAVDDCGRLLNPLLAEGQVHGGIAQGVAQALLEEVRYDADGNNLTGTLASYRMPSAAELPSFDTARMQTPSPLNPLGAKGIGESGAIGSTPAVHNAVVDALVPYGVTHLDMPTTPERVWRALREAHRG